MQSVFVEGGLEFDFSNSLTAEKYDLTAIQGLSLVDFVVETDNALYFIEVKNFDHRDAPTAHPTVIAMTTDFLFRTVRFSL